MRSYRVRLLPALLAAIGLALLLMGAVGAQPLTPPAPIDGQSTFSQNCAPCHGDQGLGDGAAAGGLGVQPTAFADFEVISALTLQGMFDVTQNGRMERMMPPWSQRLSEAEIWNAVAYAWTLHTSADEVAAGQVVFDSSCASCHGSAGEGTVEGPALNDLATTAVATQASWAEVVRDGRGKMPAFDGQLSATEQRAVLEFARSLAFDQMFRDPLAPGAGVISGTVTNQTTGQPAAGVTVDVGIFDSATVLDQRSAVTDPQGRFTFAELPTDPAYFFVARVEYPAGYPYSSEVVSFGAGQQVLDLPITVYETTSDPAGVSAERVHFIVEFASGRALIAELIVFSLTGDRAYIGDGAGSAEGVLRFELPFGAEDLELSDGALGERYLPTDTGFVDTLPLPPGMGTRQVLYRYALPITGPDLDLARSLPYPIVAANALISDVGAKISSPQMTEQGVRDTENGSYVTLSAANVPAGQQLVIRMAGLGAGASTGQIGGGTSTQGTVLWLVVGLAGLAAALAIALPLLRRGQGALQAVALDREALVDELALLEEEYRAGRVAESAYRDRRLRLKAALQDALRRPDGLA